MSDEGTRGKALVGRLLKPTEVRAVAGGDGYSQGGNFTQTGGNFTQVGGSHGQTGGGSYSMTTRFHQ